MSSPSLPELEWLEADGQGGFAMGTASGVPTRRYHGVLVAATTPPTGRMMLVNAFEAWVETASGPVALSSLRYAPDVLHPDGARRIRAFEAAPFPRWTYTLPDGSAIEHELFVAQDPPRVALSWRSSDRRGPLRLTVRPFLSGRGFHALHQENPAFRFDATVRGEDVVWRPYTGIPGIRSSCNGRYRHEPLWHRHVLYREEQERGLDSTEDLASPGVLIWDLSAGAAVWLLAAENPDAGPVDRAALDEHSRLRRAELSRRRRFPTPGALAADAYIVRRGAGASIIAGYPWFADWGRDTFVSLRGLCLASGRFADARDVLLTWAAAVSEGMLPNRFPEDGRPPEYNSIDAGLWFVVAAGEHLEAAARGATELKRTDRRQLEGAIEAILAGCIAGARWNIRADADGLLAGGAPGVQLTWMDARVGDDVITPRSGKPVEVQALWLNALAAARRCTRRWDDVFERGVGSFRERFWNPARGCLYDVVDADHVPGRTDAALRPNQIFAVGGLPLQLLPPEQARSVVDVVEQRLLTPAGLRSLAPGEPGYVPRCVGGAAERDAAYHQGTVWPWLMGPFIEAWVRVRGGGREARVEARRRLLDPFLARLRRGGAGHLPEIADGDPPHAPRGCPCQAWSLAEALRADLVVLTAGDDPHGERG